MRRCLVVGVLALVACTKRNPRACLDGVCVDPAFPFCDVDGEVEGQADTCIAVSCTAGQFETCRGDFAITCNAEGTNFDLIQCERGCEAGTGCHLCDPNETACTNGTVATCDAAGTVVSATPCPLGCFESEPRCRELESSNNLDQFLDASRTAQDLDLSRGGTIDTVSGEARDANNTVIPLQSVLLPAPANGSAIRVVIAKRVMLGNVQVNASNTGGNQGPALAIVAGAEVTLTGSLNLWLEDPEGNRAQPGAVAFAGCRGANGMATNQNSPPQDIFSGSGGGAHATAGGAGGAVENRVDGGVGGVPSGTATLIPLRGGCDGGGGCGGGGGAIQITSRIGIELGTNAVINANGNIGVSFATGPQPICGAGAGGGILLEAPSVILKSGSRLLVNGGPGDSDAVMNPPVSITTTPSPGATCTTTGGFACGNGGNGAAADGPATAGALVPYSTSASFTQFRASGGGGGLGFIRINTADGTFTQASDAIKSGSLSTGIVSTR